MEQAGEEPHQAVWLQPPPSPDLIEGRGERESDQAYIIVFLFVSALTQGTRWDFPLIAQVATNCIPITNVKEGGLTYKR